MASLRASVRSAAVAGGRVADTAAMTAGVDRGRPQQAVVQHVDGRPVPAEQVVAGVLVDGRGEFQQDREVVRQFAGPAA